MKHVSLLIKPASSLCNLKCTYCFYNDISSMREVQSYGIMSKDTTTKMIDNVYKDLEDSDHLSLVFQGGEPTLSKIEYYKYLVDYVKTKNPNVEVHYSLQTNGYTIDEEWATFFKENNVLVGISLDGPAIIHDQYRKTWNQELTHDRIIKSKNILDEYKVDYNILTVLTNHLPKHASEVMSFIKDEDVEFIQFIPCLDDLGCQKKNQEALDPELFYDFYKEMFEFWLQDLSEGKYTSIKLFDDIFNLFVNRQVTACGLTGNCQIQMVVEGDGTTFPCDFYVLDEYKLGNITDTSIYDLANHKNAAKFMTEREPLKEYCRACPYVRYCAGGCKRMSKSMYVNEDETFCGYQKLLDLYLPNIDDIITYLEKIN